MTYQFNDPAPAGGDSLPLKDIAGHYVIVKPLEFVPAVPTVHGPTDAIRVNVADLSTGTHHLNVLWFGRAVVPSLRQSIGAPGFILGQVAQGEAKPGQDPPWILVSASSNPQVAQAAGAWLDANPGVLDGAPLAAPAPAPGLAPVAPQAPQAAPVAPLTVTPGLAGLAQGLAPGVAPPQGGLI